MLEKGLPVNSIKNTYFIYFKIRNTTLYRIPGNSFAIYIRHEGGCIIILRNRIGVIFNYSYLWLHSWVTMKVCIYYGIFYFLYLLASSSLWNIINIYSKITYLWYLYIFIYITRQLFSYQICYVYFIWVKYTGWVYLYS